MAWRMRVFSLTCLFYIISICMSSEFSLPPLVIDLVSWLTDHRPPLINQCLLININLYGFHSLPSCHNPPTPYSLFIIS